MRWPLITFFQCTLLNFYLDPGKREGFDLVMTMDNHVKACFTDHDSP